MSFLTFDLNSFHRSNGSPRQGFSRFCSRMVVFEVIEQAPQRLLEVEGIAPKRARRITASWSDQKVIREIMAFLQGHGVSTSRAVRIFKTYGADDIPLVTENPYRLARDITGIGFKSADLIAERLGISRTAMVRARAGIAYTLAEAMTNGHCWVAEDELLAQAEKLLEIPSVTLAEALQAELATGEVAAGMIAEHR